ncbi:MAG TPA: polysaccharide deacetylase family protein [Acidimicrobiales bacterium]|nr:polysaccharide deacetylase family protein [Acidimicrobiales bacterium]
MKGSVASGHAEELSAAPGALAERVHPGGSVTRVDAGGQCHVLANVRADGSTSVVIRQDEGRSWHRAVPGPTGGNGYELHLSEAVVSTNDAAFTAIRRGGAGWVLVVVEGTVHVTGPTAASVEVSALQAVKISSRGVGTRRDLTPAEVEAQPWVMRNRARDGQVILMSPVPRRLALPQPATTTPPVHGKDGAPVERLRRAARRGAAGGKRLFERVAPRLGRFVVLAVAALLGVLRKEAAAERRLFQRLKPHVAHLLVLPLAGGRGAVRKAAAARRVLERARPRLASFVVVTLVLGLFTVAPDSGPVMSVTVNGQPVRISRSQPTVANAMGAAGVASANGALLSAGTRTVIDPHFAPATVLVDGFPSSPDAKLGEGADIDVAASADVVEPTGTRRVSVPPPPLPEVEFTLWYPGADGVEDQVYGLLSGEVVSRSQVKAPRPPREERGNVVALTFDDGPHPEWTPQILDILAAEGVKATFCVVGTLGRRHPDLVRAVRDAGHALCNHTETHAVGLDRADRDTVVEEIQGASELLESLLGTAPQLYRPPAGSLSPDVIDVAHERGMRVLHWTVDSRDFTKPPPEELLSRVLDAAAPGAVILLHDGDGDRSRTVAALRPLIQQLRERGFTFATPLAAP